MVAKGCLYGEKLQSYGVTSDAEGDQSPYPSSDVYDKVIEMML